MIVELIVERGTVSPTIVLAAFAGGGISIRFTTNGAIFIQSTATGSVGAGALT